MGFSDLTREGRLALAVGMAMLGAFSLIWGDLNPGLQPALSMIDGGPPLAYAAGAFLILCGIALFPARLSRQAAFTLAGFWGLWLVLGHFPTVLATPASPVAWVSLSEAAAITVAALLAGFSHYGPAPLRIQLTARGVTGLMLVWFGVVHLMYREAIAGMIPAWMPLRDLWPWVTAAANIAAGLGLISGIKGRLAGTLAGAMFASWILLVHIPHLISQPGNRDEWAALGLNVALIGVVWITGAAAFRKPA